jgi:hypothetical protein
MVYLLTMDASGMIILSIADFMVPTSSPLFSEYRNLKKTIRKFDIKINIGGDQLTRERFSRAKSLRAGANDPKEQLKHLHPITFEMFHLHMNFLMVFFKFLYSEKSGDEVVLPTKYEIVHENVT